MANLYDELEKLWDKAEHIPEAVKKRYIDERGFVLMASFPDCYTNPQNFKDKNARTYIFADLSVPDLVVCQCVGDVVRMEWSVDRNMLDLAWKKLDKLMA